jgi:DNA-binding response OmpR family regulator
MPSTLVVALRSAYPFPGSDMQILFLSEDVHRASALAARLRPNGISLIRHADPHVLDDSNLYRGLVATVIDSRTVDGNYRGVMARLGRVGPQFVIALVGDGDGERSAAWAAGVNVCLSRYVEVDELSAALRVLALKRAPDGSDGEAQENGAPLDVWSFRDDGVTLVAPTGATIILTSRERDFMNLLMANRGNPVDTRDGIEFSNRDETRRWFLDRQMIPMVVCRLRRKLAKVGLDLPIRTIYGVGYAFAQSGSFGISDTRLAGQHAENRA